MYQVQFSQDTIVAISTPSGAGGLAVVRLSGQGSADVLGKVFSAKSAGIPATWKANVLHYGWVKDGQGLVMDESLAVVMRAPRSYTAEDSAEIQTHGGPAVVRAVLDLCLLNGARLAEPGEFTKRAFLNGRIDLAQAEAVLDMVAARTDLMLRAANYQLSGNLSQAINLIREQLMNEYTKIEALLNFPEDDTALSEGAPVYTEIVSAQNKIKDLLETSRAGLVLKEGVRMVICGKPNVGKSSLLNALLRHHRAIVTDVAGTTRDTLEESANLKGIPVNLIDTAGILEPRDKVEAEAVRRSHASLAAADIMVLVLDSARPLEDVDRDLLMKAATLEAVIVLNKCDLPAQLTRDAVSVLAGQRKIVDVSATNRQGIDMLEDVLVDCAIKGNMPDPGAVVLTNIRHVEALRLAAADLEQAAEALKIDAPLEMVSHAIKGAINRLDAITGRNIDADALERIFSSFCIGK